MSDIHEGGCPCGAVRYRTMGLPLRTLVCHCRFCQRMTGSAFYAESMFAVEAVQFSGVLHVHEHRSATSGKAVRPHFCPTCATTVTLTFERWPEYHAISRGTGRPARDADALRAACAGARRPLTGRDGSARWHDVPHFNRAGTR